MSDIHKILWNIRENKYKHVHVSLTHIWNGKTPTIILINGLETLEEFSFFLIPNPSLSEANGCVRAYTKKS